MKRALFASALLAASILPSVAQARCEEDGSDLNGRWTIYVSTTVGGGTTHLQQCLNATGRNGEFQPVRCRTIRLGASELAVDRRCQITGNWFIELPNGTQRGCDVLLTLHGGDHLAFDGFLNCDSSPQFWNMRGIKR